VRRQKKKKNSKPSRKNTALLLHFMVPSIDSFPIEKLTLFSVENWHCILRNGLKNASGTKLQLNGAAYGKGIYISPNATVSFGYSQIASVAPQRTSYKTSDNLFLNNNTNFKCVALCEGTNIL
jgi:hypothetical protein